MRRIVLPTEKVQHYIDYQEEEETLRACLAELEARRLKPEEERALSIRALAGDTEAIWTLVLHNRKLAVSIALRYRGRGLSLLDLIQEGTLGLWEAAKRFDAVQFQTHFSTYAMQWICQAISRALVSKGQAIRVPDYIGIARARVRRYESDGEAHSKEEVLAALNLSEPLYQRAKESMHSLESLETAVLGDDDGHALRLVDTLAAPMGEEDMIDPQQKDALHALLRRILQPREYDAIVLRFGLDGKGPRKLREAGVEMGITRERVRQLEKSAMQKLQRIAPRLRELFSA